VFPLLKVTELEPTREPEPEALEPDEPVENLPEVEDPDEGKSDGDIRDEINGQLTLF
jgi:topoisomerase-4 subunit A